MEAKFNLTCLKIKKFFLQQIVKHCQQEYPREACGILAGKIKAKIVEKIYPMTNVASNPSQSYLMKPEEQFKVFKEMRELKIEMLAIYHSHPYTSAYPSAKDIGMAFSEDIFYLIISLKNFHHPRRGLFKIFREKEGEVTKKPLVIS